MNTMFKQQILENNQRKYYMYLQRGKTNEPVNIQHQPMTRHESKVKITLVMYDRSPLWTWASFSCSYKVSEMEFLHIWCIKYRLITKLITELVCKLRDEFINAN